MRTRGLHENHEINSTIDSVVRYVETMAENDSEDTGFEPKHAVETMTEIDSDDTRLELKHVQSTRSTRGKVQLNKLLLRRARGIIQEVEFNKHGHPFGPVASEMQSYIGLLARQEVKISYKSWKLVPNEVKEFIWESVNRSYKVDQKWKSGCLESANGKWRQFKSTLFNKFIVPNQNDPVKLNQPPEDSGILQEDWSIFVKDRMSEEFKILSAEQKERRMKHIYPHRLSRRGYAGLAEEMKDELCGDDEIDRAVMWKKARVSKNGDFEDENLKKAVERIDEYIQQKEDGLIKSNELAEDLLTCALETRRARAVGGYIPYPKEKRRGIDDKLNRKISEHNARLDENKALLGKLSARMDKLEEIIGKLVAQNKDNDEKSSCSVSVKSQYPKIDAEFDDDDDDDDVQLVDKVDSLQGKKVALTLASTNAIVAYATIVTNNGPNQKIYGTPFPKTCTCVLVDEVVDEKALLPIPIPNMYDCVGDAVGAYAAWPTHLMVVQNKRAMKKKVERKKVEKDKVEMKNVEKDQVEMKVVEKDKVEMKEVEKDKAEMKEVEKERIVTDYANLPRSLKMLYCYCKHALKDGKGISFSLEDDVFGNKCQILVHLEDIIPFCDLEPISGNCIIAYIWHLYNKMEENKLGCFQFVNPFTISYVPKSRLTERARVLADRLISASVNQLVLVPCNVGNHWILTIVDPFKEVVFLLDPLSHRNRDETWKSVVNRAINMFNTNLGKKGKKQPTWEIIQAPRQPDSKQCGFYVMRYMRDIIEGFETTDSISIRSLRSLFRKGEYSQKEIDEVRNEWADCVQDHI